MELCREGGLGLPGAGTGRRSGGGEGEGQEEEGRRAEEEKGGKGKRGMSLRKCAADSITLLILRS